MDISLEPNVTEAVEAIVENLRDRADQLRRVDDNFTLAVAAKLERIADILERDDDW